MRLGSKLDQTATLWTRDGTLDWAGAQGWNTPSTILVRWVEEENVIRKESGQELAAKHKITASVDIDEGDWLALGDETGNSEPTGVSGAVEIKAKLNIPSVRGNEFLYVVVG